MYGELRLAGGLIHSEGRVEICINGNFGIICDDSWDNADAMVVCRQLGYDPNSECLPHTQLQVWCRSDPPLSSIISLQYCMYNFNFKHYGFALMILEIYGNTFLPLQELRQLEIVSLA